MWRPSIRRSIQVGQTSAESLGVGTVLAPLIGLGISGAIAYVGFKSALTQKGWYQALGWVAGIAGALGGLSSLAWMMGFGSMAQAPAPVPPNGAIVQEMTSEGTV